MPRLSRRIVTFDAADEPLFARHARLWLWIWLLTQLTALALGTMVALFRAPSPRPFVAAVTHGALGAMLLAFVATHLAAAVAHRWLLAHTLARVALVALCFALAYAIAAAERAYGLLILGVALQGFVFLPGVWAGGALALMVCAGVVAAIMGGPGATSVGIVSRVGGVLLLGTVTGTILLYVHRANADARVREALLRQLHDAQRTVERQAREAGVLEERERLAHDLHDTLAQDFASIVTQLSAAELAMRRDGNADAAAAERHVMQAQAIARASLGEIRRLVLALRPSPLSEAPLGTALPRVVREWAAVHGVQAEVEVGALPALDNDAEVLLLRATQEALSNVSRHAAARRVSVTLQRADDLVLLEVEDDGVGMPNGSAPEGLGLLGMRERARRFGGRVIVEPAAGGGTSLTVALPLAAIST